MSDLPPDSRPLPESGPEPDPTQAIPTEQVPAQDRKQRLRDRLWSLRAVIAVALASVVIGGLGGAALANVSERGGDARVGPGNGRFNPGGPGGPPGQTRGGPRERKQFPGRGHMGQRQWDQEGDGSPGTPLTPLPGPAVPTPKG